MHIKRKRLIIISSVLIFFGLLIILDRVILPNSINKKYVDNLQVKQKQLEDNKQEEEENSFKSLVPTQNSDKAVYYVGKFIGYINKSDYENAYKCLNEKFKSNNFGTVENFKNYCNNKYNSFRTISLLNYKINDDIIIAQIELKSINDGTSIIQFFTIREEDSKTSNFEISFGI